MCLQQIGLSLQVVKRTKINILNWFFIILFTGYVGGISLFTHTHVVNNTKYVHSHPFKVGEETQHTHTDKQLLTLDFYYKTTITSDILPKINLSALLNPITTPYIDLYCTPHLLEYFHDIPARGPPVVI